MIFECEQNTVLIVECFSCGKEFELEENNDREEGYFCDECLINSEG